MPWPISTHTPQAPMLGRFLSFPTLLSFALAGVFLLFLVTRFDVDLGKTWESFQASNLLYFVLALLIHYTTFLFRGARWRILLKNAQGGAPNSVPNTLHCARLILLGWFTNSVTLFRLGDAYRAYAYVEDTGASFPRTIGTILAERALDMALVFLLVVVATMGLVATGTGASWTFVVLAAALVAVLVGILLSMGLFRSRLARRLPGSLQGAYHRFHEGTVGSFHQVPLATALGLLGWLAEVGRLYFVAEALGFPLSVPLVIFVTLAIAMLTLFPVTPGGLGAVELGATGLLMLSSRIDTETVAFSIVALDRSISWLSVIIFGAVIFLGREVIKSRRRRVTAVREALTSKG